MKSFASIIDSWTTPTGIAVIFGCIVWGVQLNYAIMSLTSEVTKLTATTAENKESIDSTARMLLETSLVLKQIQRDMADALVEIEDHDKESDDWKQRIIRLETQNGHDH